MHIINPNDVQRTVNQYAIYQRLATNISEINLTY